MSFTQNNNFDEIIKELKSNLTSEERKESLNIENISNVFSTLLSGNEYFKNFQVKDFSAVPKMKIRENLKARDKGIFQAINTNRISSKLLNVTSNNEIIFDSEAVLKLGKFPISYKVKDFFEVLAFLKYLMRICGYRMEKCDFDNLVKEANNKTKLDLIEKLKVYEKNYEKIVKFNGNKENEKLDNNNSTNLDVGTNYTNNNNYSKKINSEVKSDEKNIIKINNIEQFKKLDKKNIEKNEGKNNLNLSKENNLMGNLPKFLEVNKKDLFKSNNEIASKSKFEEMLDLEVKNYQENMMDSMMKNHLDNNLSETFYNYYFN